MKKHVESCCDEMELLGADESTLFFLFGGIVQQLFFENLSFYYRNAVMCKHYSYYGMSVDKWLKELRETLVSHREKTKRMDERNPESKLRTPEYTPER